MLRCRVVGATCGKRCALCVGRIDESSSRKTERESSAKGAQRSWRTYVGCVPLLLRMVVCWMSGQWALARSECGSRLVLMKVCLTVRVWWSRKNTALMPNTPTPTQSKQRRAASRLRGGSNITLRTQPNWQQQQQNGTCPPRLRLRCRVRLARAERRVWEMLLLLLPLPGWLAVRLFARTKGSKLNTN